MSETTTWYRVKQNYGNYDQPWVIVPIQVVRQTVKTIIILESWEATAWGIAGSRERREFLDGSQFDNLEAANDAVRDRLQAALDSAIKAKTVAVRAMAVWKDVVKLFAGILAFSLLLMAAPPPSSEHSVTLLWQLSTLDDPKYQTIYRQLHCDPAHTTKWRVSSTTVDWTDEHVQNKQNYCYYVTVTDIDKQESGPSNVVSVTIPQE